MLHTHCLLFELPLREWPGHISISLSFSAMLGISETHLQKQIFFKEWDPQMAKENFYLTSCHIFGLNSVWIAALTHKLPLFSYYCCALLIWSPILFATGQVMMMVMGMLMVMSGRTFQKVPTIIHTSFNVVISFSPFYLHCGLCGSISYISIHYTFICTLFINIKEKFFIPTSFFNAKLS